MSMRALMRRILSSIRRSDAMLSLLMAMSDDEREKRAIDEIIAAVREAEAAALEAERRIGDGC